MKHLRAILNSLNISTNTCKEKHDLVDLFIRNKDEISNFMNSSETSDCARNTINNDSHHFNNASDTSQRQSPLFNNPLDSLISNFQGFVSSNLGSVLNSDPVPCPPPPNRANNSNPNASSSSSSTSSQNFSSIFDAIGNQIPNVFSQFTQNSQTNANQSECPFQSDNQNSSHDHKNQSLQNNSDIKRRASLSNIKSVQDIENMTIKQIKEILANNFVDFKGCCEKKELVEKLERLFNSHNENKRREAEIINHSIKNDVNQYSEDKDLCKICMEFIMDCVLLDCGHMCSCIKCGKRLTECPICRQNVVKVVRIFKS